MNHESYVIVSTSSTSDHLKLSSLITVNITFMAYRLCVFILCPPWSSLQLRGRAWEFGAKSESRRFESSLELRFFFILC